MYCCWIVADFGWILVVACGLGGGLGIVLLLCLVTDVYLVVLICFLCWVYCDCWCYCSCCGFD